MTSPTVQSFLQQSFLNYQTTHAMPLYQLKAAQQLMVCRTQTLGGHAVYCEDGHLNGVWYNSCKHRSCPQCCALKSAQWQQRAEALLLECQHHHWVFTLPHDLHAIWRFNRAFCQPLFFRCVRETLQKLSQDPRYLAATPGYILAFHSWARNQVFHPHIHCVISHGGLDKTGHWHTPKRQSFLPAKVMMHIFRGKYLAGIKKALASGDLVVPTNETKQRVINLCNKLGRTDWILHCVPAYEHGVGVAKYLARYIKGGAIKNSQILRITEHSIKFRYKSHQTKQTEYLTLTHAQFMQRLLSHIAIPRKQQYQLLGLYHGRSRAKLNVAREQLGQVAVEKIKEIDWQIFMDSKGIRALCETCGKPLMQLRDLEQAGEVEQLKIPSLH
jgi:nitrite reductase/ring-hydroxylating ferredoxin subunit